MEIPSAAREVVLIEDGDQLDAVLDSTVPRVEGTVIVTLTPAAESAADRAGIPHIPIDALYMESELFRLGDENSSRVDAFCRGVDEDLDQHRSEDASALAGFSAFDFFPRLRVLFDAVLSRTFCLESAVQKLRPQRITYFRAYADPLQDDLLFRDRSLTPAVVPQLAERVGIAVCERDPPRVRSAGTARTPRWRPVVSRSRDGLAHLHWRVFGSGQHRGGMTLIPISEGYDLGPVIREWHHRNLALIPFRPLRWRMDAPVRGGDPRATRLGQRLLDHIERDERFVKLFDFGGVKAFGVMRPRLEHLFLRVLPEFAMLVQRARMLLRKIPEGVVVGTPAMALPQLAVLVAARSLGMPTALYQHGGGYGVLKSPMVEHHELALADYFLCYGPKVAEFFRSEPPPAPRSPARPRAAVLPVGSAALDELRKRPRPSGSRTQSASGTRTVVYVVTNFSGDTGYFDYRTYPDLAYWRLQKEVVLRCARRRDIRLLIKLHPNDGLSHPMIDLVRDRSLTNCQVLVETPFTDLLDMADLFIIDYPSSTSLLQALTTGRKILALADQEYTRPDARAVELLRRRLFLATSRDEFLRGIDATLEEPDWTLPQPINNGALHAYGTGPEGNSAGRAIAALLEIHASRGSHLADLHFHEVTTA